MSIQVTLRDPRDSDMTAILQAHLDFCLASTPIEHVHALDISKLVSPQITVFGAQLDGELVGVGAIRILDEKHAELKSMHTLARVRGRGVGRAMIAHISDFAREKGIERLSLETGTSEAFRPARELYESLGFKPCEAFGEYENTEDNVCMSKSIL